MFNKKYVIAATVLGFSMAGTAMSASAAKVSNPFKGVYIISNCELPEFPNIQCPIIPEIHIPECPETPEIPDTPEVPEIPEVPETPEAPEKPELPEKPEIPNRPEKPEVPETPEIPDTPESPEISESAFAMRVIELVNEERAKAGLPALKYDATIGKAALVRAKETEVSFSHTRPNGSSFATALKEQGVSYRSAGENIAWGQRTPEQVMEGWMNSPGHRANILNKNFTKIGVGYYQNARGVAYWTQLFAS